MRTNTQTNRSAERAARKISPKCVHVAVLVDTTDEWGRSVVRGIGKYAMVCGSWRVWLWSWGRNAPVPLAATWAGDGIIAGVYNEGIAHALKAIRKPIVNVSISRTPGLNLPRLTTDFRMAARLAAEHLLNCGLRHFAYCGRHRDIYVQNYCAEFVDALRKAGHDCRVFESVEETIDASDSNVRQPALSRWLMALPKPVGVFAWPTHFARQVVSTCRETRLAVPEQVAVLAGDEDDVLCHMCHPPLSGVALNSERVGYEAAVLLHRLMQGKRAPKQPIFVEPIAVVARQSTDMLAINDADVAHAVAFIRENAARPIGVADVVRSVSLSRRQLELRFRAVFDRTLAAEIRRVHLERAKQLLAETTMSIPVVAAGSGFGSSEYLARVFNRCMGLAPHEYRAKVHGR
ncbi:MAG: XylR family transcriptional regulator [Verrucomicrobia bacterium]|nr:XylR family transcriptional regulator [Verrucomicrobiota bacterium]